MTPEEEDVQAERFVYRLLIGVIEAHNWQDTRSMVSILRALQRASLTLVASHPRRVVTREAGDAGVMRLMEVLTEWVGTLALDSSAEAKLQPPA